MSNEGALCVRSHTVRFLRGCICYVVSPASVPRSDRAFNVTAPLHFAACDRPAADDIAALAIQHPGPGFAGPDRIKSAIALVG